MKKLIFNRTFVLSKTHLKEKEEFLSNLPNRYETSNPLMMDIAWDEGYEIFLLDENKKEVNIRDLTLSDLILGRGIAKLYLKNYFMNTVHKKKIKSFKEFGRGNNEENYLFSLIENTFGGKYPEECGVDYKDVFNNIKHLNRIIEFCLSELEVTHYMMTNGNVDVLDCKAEVEKGLKEHKERIEKIL